MEPFSPDMPALLTSLYSILPEILVVATAIFVLLLDLVVPEENKRILCGSGLVGIGIALFSVYALGQGKIEGFSGMIVHDGAGAFFDVVILSACALTLLMASGYSEWEGTNKGEFYALILLSTSGMMFMAKGADLMTVFLGLETLSIPIYVLVGFHRKRMSSVEGALKYFLLGAFASGFLLYGIALMYAATGTTKIPVHDIALAASSASETPLFNLGVLFVVLGFGFKVSLVPFHMWTPDAYEGAPTVVTAFMSAAVKAAAFAALIRVLLVALPGVQPALWKVLKGTTPLAPPSARHWLGTDTARRDVLSRMIHGARVSILVGLVSVSIYVLLGTLLGLAAAWYGGWVDLLVSRLIEIVMVLPVFFVILKGVGFKYPVLGALLTLFPVSLGGIPPTAGFVGKFYLFSAAVKNGYIWLAVIGVLNSAASVYYYLRLVVYMYMTPADGEVSVPRPPRILFSLALSVSAVVVVVLGIVPRAVLEIAERSILSMLM